MNQPARSGPARRAAPVLALALFGALVGAFAGRSIATGQARPDVVLVTIDTLRADHLSSYGYDRGTSPAIDELLASGARFAQARTVEPLTAPALASMVTGLHPHEHGSTRNGLAMRPNLASFSRAMSRRGYETAAFVGNWTLKDEISGMAEHFETYEALLSRKRWFGLAKREATAEDLNEAALDWLDDHLDRSPRRPFLLWIHYVEPHAPYRLRGEYLEQVGVRRTGTFFSARNRYDTEIAYVDEQMRTFLDGVEERLDGADPLVVFAADHGESLGHHGYWGHGRHLYDATLHIPMGITWPGRVDPATIEAPASLLDLGPTLLGLLGLPVPEHFRGYDWSRVLLDGAPAPSGRVTLHQAHRSSVGPNEDSDRLRQKGLLEVGRLEAGMKEIYRVVNDRRRRFDLSRDREEQNSLVPLGSPPSDELAAWREEVTSGLEVSDELPPPNLSEEDIEALRALGYID